MDSMIGRALQEARAKAFGLQVRATNSVSPAQVMGGTGYGGMDALGRGAQSMAQHAEQMLHYSGMVYSLIRVIGNRVAAQPFRVASRDGALATPGPRQPYSRPQAWVDGDGTQSGGQGWRFYREAWKKHLPDSVKGMADHAHILDDHAILRCLSNPNPIMVRSTVIFNTVASLQLTGKAHWWLEQTPEGYWRIWPIPASWIEPVHGDETEEGGGLFANWKLTVPGTGEPLTVPGADVAYFYYPDPNNPLGATSPLQALARTVLVDESLENSQLRAFQNGLNPGLALIVGRLPEQAGIGGAGAERPVLNKEQRNQIINAVKAHYRGVMNTDEPLILDGLIQDAKKISQTVREMDFLQSSLAVQARLAKGWGVNPISMGQVEGANRACHDDQTELLTERGWLRHDQVKVGDIAATMNPKTGRFEWQPVSHVHVYGGYRGEMVRLSGEKIDALMTPDHRVWTRRGCRAGRTTPDSEYAFKTAGELRCHDVLPLAPLPQAARYSTEFMLPGVESGGGVRESGVKPEVVVDMDALLEFVGWFASEGWTVSYRCKKSGRSYYTVGVKQAVGGVEECRRIYACMAALGVGRVRVNRRSPVAGSDTVDGYDRQATNTYSLDDKRLWTWLRDECGVGSANKKLPGFIFGMAAEQAVRTLDALLLGDGSHREASASKRYSGLHAAYFSTSPALMDQVQTLALVCGRSARMRKRMSSGVYCMGVSEYSREMSLLPKHISREQYSGTVWCVTVPNGLIVTRRNGKPLVSGNSAAVADDSLCANVVNPLISMISEVMTARLGPRMAPGENLLLYLEEAKSRDIEFERTQADGMVANGTMTLNERRAVIGLPPLVEGNVIVVGGKMIPVALDEPGVRRSPPVRVKTRPDRPQLSRTPSSTGDSPLSATHEEVVRSWLVSQAQAETALRTTLEEYLVGVGETICTESADRLRKDVKAVKSTQAHEALLEEYLDPARWTEGLRKALAVPMMRAAYSGSAIEWLSARGFKKSGPALPVEVERQALVEVNKLLALDYWGGIFETARKSAVASLEYLKGEGGTGTDLLHKAVRSSLGQGPAGKKAAEIAATEAAAAINAGAHLVRGQLRRVGKATHKVWWSLGDGSVRDAHRKAHGQTVEIDAAFAVGGEEAQYPGDPKLSPKNRCRCRCATLTVGNSDYD